MTLRSLPLMLTSALALTAGAAADQQSFNRIASFATPLNMAAGEATKRVTSAKIISASEDGMMLIYTDSPQGVVGLIDITDPAKPAPKGNIDENGEPTTAVILSQTAFVGVNTSESHVAPSGALRTIDLATAQIAAVYDITDPKAPVLKQLLPSGVSPEGAVAIPARGLLATANEVDFVEDGGARSHVMIYALSDAAPAYPMIMAGDGVAAFGALSGMVAGEGMTIYAVNDSFYGYQTTIFTIDASRKPAKITAALEVTRAGMPAQKLDLEGIALDGQGGFWVASEGDLSKLVPHAILNVNAKGEIKQEIGLPAAYLGGEKRFGFEGITQVGDTLWMAVQREWGDDPKGMVKLMAYNLEAKEWGAVHYPLNPVAGGWIGLSEITAHGDHVYIVERDNQIGAAAVEKKLYRVPVAQLVPAKAGEALPVVTKELVRDLLPDLAVLNGYAMDKIEGFAINADGEGFVVTDNDGVDDASGETLFWSVGKM